MKKLFSRRISTIEDNKKDPQNWTRADSAVELSHKYEDVNKSKDIASMRSAAESGSAQSQFHYGTHLYTEAKLSGSEKHARQGIHWLVQASINGHDEATRLLKKCLEDKFGVDEKNVEEVKACLQMDGVEKSLRSAASKLYNQLRAEHQSSETFPLKLYLERVGEVASVKQEKKFLESTGKKLQSQAEVQLEDFVETVTRRMRSGQIDPTEDEVEMAAYNEASLTRKITKYPGVTLTLATDTVVETITTDGVNLAMTLIPFEELKLLIIFFVLSLLSFRWLFTVSSLLAFYVFFFVMVVCTLQMLKTRSKQKEVKVMAEMLQRYNGSVQPEEVVSMFIHNSMRPYWTFFSVLLIFLPAFFMSSLTWVPCSEMAVISWSLCGATLVYLSPDFDRPLIHGAVGLAALSSLPQILAGFPEVPLLYYVINLVTSSFFSIELFAGFSLHISIPSLAYLSLPAIFIKTILDKSWNGLYRTLIPLMVSLVWWEIGVIFFVNSTWLGLVRGSMGWLSFVLLLPVIAVVGVFVTLYYMFIKFGIAGLIKVGATLSILAIPILLTLWQESGFSAGSLSLRGKSLKVKLAVIFVPLLLLGGVAVLSGGEEEEGTTYVPWNLYKDLCTQPAWTKTNMAVTQVTCAGFKYMEVDWTGTVKSVMITEIDNPAEAFFSQLPDFISEWMKCIYGTRYPVPDTADLDMDSVDPDLQLELDVQSLRSMYGRSCHLDAYADYSFLVKVAMDTGDEDNPTFITSITADSGFQKTLVNLREGNEVNFRATILDKAGSANVQLELTQIKCLDCPELEQELVGKREGGFFVRTISKGIMNTIDFFTSPVLHYTA